MFGCQLAFRQLYESIRDRSEGMHVAADILKPWASDHPSEREWLLEFKERSGTPVPLASSEELSRLYALQRVLELLLLTFQSGKADGSSWSGPKISLAEYEAFVVSQGLTLETHPRFSPFYHEVVEVKQADDANEEVRVSHVHWPCLMLGDLLIARAGVTVSAGVHQAAKAVAESSTLYWAHRRKNRPTFDLSNGWGSNSQWRTSFRRDYRIQGVLHFNVDAEHDLANEAVPLREDSELDRDQWIAFVMQRCLLHETPSVKDDRDLWPYSYSFRCPW